MYLFIFHSIIMLHIDSYCVKELWCCFPIPLLIFIYSVMGLLICKYEALWQEVSVKSLILRWPLRPVGLLHFIHYYFIWNLVCVSVWITVNLQGAYDNSPGVFAKRFDDLMEVFAKDRQTNCFVMHCLLLKKIAETQPEVLIIWIWICFTGHYPLYIIILNVYGIQWQHHQIK